MRFTQSIILSMFIAGCVGPVAVGMKNSCPNPAASESMSFMTEDKVDLEIEKHFLVSPCNEQGSFNQFLEFLWWMPWYKSNGYKIPMPSTPAFQDLGEDPEKIKTLDRDKYFKIFISEVYKPLSLIPVQEILSKSAPVLVMVLDRFNTLNKKWGFKIFPQYKITITMYGPGGCYDSNSGMVELCVDDKGFLNNRRKGHEVIIHEMVHIGIEDIIVKKFQLTHWEKEALVDRICALYFKDLLPDYWVQPSGDKRIKEYVTYEDICNDLPGAIEKYILKYPRDKN